MVAGGTARSTVRLLRGSATVNAVGVPPDIVAALRRSPGTHSPHEMLSRFDPSSALTAKCAPRSRRAFMYEEHGATKLRDDEDAAATVRASPSELAALLHRTDDEEGQHRHYYWTAPVKAVAPHLARDFAWLDRLGRPHERPLADPRGPSLWMGTSGSATQCHYDVADNVIAQLHGTKRVRIWPPRAVEALHVFPDAHPRARKSQVDFDRVACESAGDAGAGDGSHASRYPHFADLPPPSLDVVLRPGDAIEVPAFWFHHVENGRVPHANGANGGSPRECQDEPSVSVNRFSLGPLMMMAQQIFQKASLRPTILMGACVGANGMDRASSVLGVLGAGLVHGLGVVDDGKEEEFIRRHLLEARYVPLLGDAFPRDSRHHDDREPLTKPEREAAHGCVERIVPDFLSLLAEGEEEEDRGGIARLVALHLLELWAVELVGASSVARAWDRALSQ